MLHRAQPGRPHVTGAVRRRRPVPLPLEGVGGQVDALRVTEEDRPVDADPGGVRLGDRGQEAERATVVAAQGAEHHPVHPGGVERLLDPDREHRVRARLEEDVEAVVEQAARGALELDGLPQVRVPILGVQPGRVDRLAGHRGVEGDLPGAGRDRREVGEHALADRLHLHGMRGVVHRDPAGAHPVRLARGEQFIERGHFTGNHGGAGAVDRRDGQPVVPAREVHFGGRERHRDHATVPGQGVRDSQAAQRDHPGRVFEAQCPGHRGRRDLALRVPDHRLRLDAHRAPQLGERNHHRPQDRLHHVDAIEISLPAQDIDQRPVDERLQRGSAFTDPAREHRRGVQQFAAHADPLRTLAGEHERRPADGRSHPGDHPGGGFPAGERVQRLGVEHDRAMVECRTGRRQRERDVLSGPLSFADARGLRGQRGLGPRRKQPRHHSGHRRFGSRLVLGRLGLRRLLQNDVRVGAADAERRDTGPALAVQARPRALLGQQLDGPGGPVDVRGRPLGVQGLRQCVVAHRHDHLDHPGDPGRRLRVPQVRLDRAQLQGVLTVLAVRGHQGVRLDRVTQCGPGAVGFHSVHIGRVQARVRQCRPDHALLRRAVGRGQAVRSAVLVDRGTADDREDVPPVALGVGKPFQHQLPGAFGPAHAVGVVGERLAPAVRGERALLGELGERARRGHHRDATGQRERAFAAAQRLHGEVQRDQRGRARGVHRNRRALEAEGVGNPAGDDARDHAGGGLTGEQVGVVLAVRPGEHTGLRATQRVRVDPGALQRLPRGLQQQPLLRVHAQRLARGDAEETRVEVGGVVDEAAFGGAAGPGAEQGVEVPAAVAGELPDDVAAVGEQVPELLRRAHPARVAAGHADDGDGLGVLALQLLDALAGPAQVDGDPPQVFDDLVLLLILLHWSILFLLTSQEASREVGEFPVDDVE
ncbi:hypothetical protein GCM10027199_35960 [Amycolatopsis magusensis]